MSENNNGGIDIGIFKGNKEPEANVEENNFNNDFNGGANNNSKSDGSTKNENGSKIQIEVKGGDVSEEVNSGVDNSDEINIGTDSKDNNVLDMDNNGRDDEPEIDPEINGEDNPIENGNDESIDADVVGEENEEKKGVKQIKTRYGMYLTQLFGTFGPALGALSGPIGLLLIVYVFPKSTNMLLPSLSRTGKKGGVDGTGVENDSIANLNSNYKNSASDKKFGSLAPIGSGSKVPEAKTAYFGQGSLNKQNRRVCFGTKTSSEVDNEIVKKAEDIFKGNKVKDILKDKGGLEDAYNKLINNKNENENPELLVDFLIELAKPKNADVMRDINKEFERGGLGDQMKEVNKILQEQMQEVLKDKELQNLIRGQNNGELPEFYENLTKEVDFKKFCDGLTSLNEMLNSKDKKAIDNKINELVVKNFEAVKNDTKLLGSFEKFGTPDSDATSKNPPSYPSVRKGSVIVK